MKIHSSSVTAQLSICSLHYGLKISRSIFRSDSFFPFCLSEKAMKIWTPNFMLSLFSSNFPAIQHNSHELHCIPRYLSKKQSGAEILKIVEALGIKIMPKWLFSSRHQENLEICSTFLSPSCRITGERVNFISMCLGPFCSHG